MGRYGKFTPSYSGLGALLRGPEMQAEMKSRAEKIEAAAIAGAPTGDAAKGDRHPGEYKASFTSGSDVRHTDKGTRAVGYVRNSAPHAAAVEYGYRGRSAREGQAAHHTLGRAIDHARD